MKNNKKTLPIILIILVIIAVIFLVFTNSKKEDEVKDMSYTDLSEVYNYYIKKGEDVAEVQLGCELYNTIYHTELAYDKLTQSEKTFFENIVIKDIFDGTQKLENHESLQTSNEGSLNESQIDMLPFFDFSEKNVMAEFFLLEGVNDKRFEFGSQLYNLVYDTKLDSESLTEEETLFFEETTVAQIYSESKKLPNHDELISSVKVA